MSLKSIFYYEENGPGQTYFLLSMLETVLIVASVECVAAPLIRSTELFFTFANREQIFCFVILSITTHNPCSSGAPEG